MIKEKKSENPNSPTNLCGNCLKAKGGVSVKGVVFMLFALYVMGETWREEERRGWEILYY